MGRHIKVSRPVCSVAVKEGNFGVDSEAWPLVVMRIPPRFDLLAIERFTRQYDEVLARKTKFVLLADTTALTGFPNAVERRHLGQLMNARNFAEGAYALGYAVVMASPTARTVYTAILWLRPAPVPQVIVSDVAAALDWCCTRLGEAGLSLTPRIEALRSANPTRAQL
jgi:hypothetical protein